MTEGLMSGFNIDVNIFACFCSDEIERLARSILDRMRSRMFDVVAELT
jgi:hypothetical protein